ncbi:MAG: ATP-dependent RecD-like DNA helicase [Ruminococcaceae bacterium]|nr:ATP-dependent RecD-like DNA helicase [Oscillospiraceae bacterium]
MKKTLETIRAVVDTIIYSNDQNGFTVCEAESENLSFCAVGYLPYLTEGETVEMSGCWTVHPDYGEQFKVEYYEKTEPSDTISIEKYLSSGVISGVGKITAKRIVELFGEDSLRIIRDEPEKLCAIRNISPAKAEKISQSLIEQNGVQTVMLFLNRYGVAPSSSLRIYKQFGTDAVDKIKENPYCLCDDMSGIGFKKADSIGFAMGIIPEDPNRIGAGIEYLLSYNSQNGHTYLPREQLISLACKLLHVSAEAVENEMVELQLKNRICSVQENGYEHIFLYDLYRCERRCAFALREMSQDIPDIPEDLEEKIKKAEKDMGIELEEMQKEAVMQAVQNRVMIITGGPGTGKTTIIRTIATLFEAMGMKVSLCAPTGRAAKRMSSLCGREAQTVHRLLEMNYDNDRQQQFARHERNPLDADVIIADEMSMVDVILLDHLLCALPAETHFIMVGDADQLPSVGPGNVLGDLLSEDCIKTVRLTEIFRQAKESQIVVNAHKINHGEYPILNQGDFFFVHHQPGELLQCVVDLCQRRLPATYPVEDLFSIQVISPSKKGEAGINVLNPALQEALNPPSPTKNERKVRDIVFREGDKVMQIKNNYDIIWTGKNGEKGTGIFNGDEGIITDINTPASTLTVCYDGQKSVVYDFLQLDELELAYAITVHKSQGSEFDIVVIPMYQAPPMLLNRNLFYTAVTRAKKLVVLAGNEGIMRKMVENNHQTERFTALNTMLAQWNGEESF